MRRAPITSFLTLRPIPMAVPGLVPVDSVTRLASIPRDRQRYQRSSRNPAVLYPLVTFSNGGRRFGPTGARPPSTVPTYQGCASRISIGL